ncbi:MAG: hypothetical protein HY893_03910 [Deltaproteobacteria bacterium]|nr:hypothetical protein [Deltaproteobacteria bacterium]
MGRVVNGRLKPGLTQEPSIKNIESMKTVLTFLIALAASALFFLALDSALFNAQGLTFLFKG